MALLTFMRVILWEYLDGAAQGALRLYLSYGDVLFGIYHYYVLMYRYSFPSSRSSCEIIYMALHLSGIKGSFQLGVSLYIVAVFLHLVASFNITGAGICL